MSATNNFWQSDIPRRGDIAFYAEAKESEWLPFFQGTETLSPPPLERVDLPSFHAWEKQVEEVVEKIGKNEVKKVVLVRRSSFPKPKGFSIQDVIAVLEKSPFGCLIQPSFHTAFFSTSPERLFVRKGRTICVDILAGTALREEELFTEKLREEIDIVKEDILEALSPLIDSFSLSPLHPHPYAPFFHLRYQLRAELKASVTDQKTIEALHPTAAIGGYPRKEAASYLEQNTPFCKGLYMAPIGWSTRDEAEFRVAIRSGLIAGDTIHLFAGAGITRGSSAKREWEELEWKISRWKQLIEKTPSPSSIS